MPSPLFFADIHLRRVMAEMNTGLSAFAEDHGCEPMDGCDRRTLRSLKSEGGCFGGFRRRDEGYHGRKPVEAS